MRISYSALETFQNCPAAFKFQYIEKIKVPKSKEAVFGSLIHETLKMFHEPSRPYPLSEEDLLKYFTQKWDPKVYDDPQEEAFAFSQGIEMLKRYYAQNQGKQFNIIDLETPFEAPIMDKNELHQITGRIDRIDKLEDGTFEVIDYKTAKKMPGQKIVDNNLQLSVYHLGLVNRWPALEDKPVKLSLYFLKHGEKVSTLRTKLELEETKEKILEVINQIKKSSFEPRPNPLCNWCQYQRFCPMFKHKFNPPEKSTITQEQIRAVIQEFFQIKERQEKDNRRLAELKEIINRYCDENNLDRVFGPEGYITRLPQKRYTYDLTRLKEILEPLGKWEEVLTLDKVKFKKVIDSLPYRVQKEINQAKKLEREFKVITLTRTSLEKNQAPE